MRNPVRRRGLTAIDGAIALIVILLLIQVWLLTAALEAYLSGNRDAALPAAIASGVLFAICVGLYLMIEGIDRSASSSKWE